MHTMTSIALALTMLLPSANAPSPRQGASPAAPQPRILDARWIPDIGTVQLSSPGGPRLDVVVRELGGTEAIERPVLDSLPADARILEARCARYLQGEGLAIGLAVEHHGTVSYHFLSTLNLLPDTNPAGSVPPLPHRWTLRDPIFTSTGEPYRIVDVHGPGSDTIEITFRRPFDSRRSKERFDEKLYVNVCPGPTDPFVGGGTLYDVSGIEPVMDARTRPR